MQENIITGLDIGSYSTKILVGKVVQNEAKENSLQIIGCGEVETQGVSKGAISNIEEAVSSISSCLESVERMIGMPVEHAWVGISGVHIQSKESKGVIAISKTNGEIQEDDVERVIEAARALATPVNYEILHVIPRCFNVDNQQGIKDPIGMSGIRLEVITQIIQGHSFQVKNLTKSVYRTGLDIDDLVLSILAAGEAVLTNRQKELGVVLINIGAATTSIAVYEEGELMHIAVLPIGSQHITSDINIGLRATLDVAENVKKEAGSALAKSVDKKAEINLKDFGGENFLVSKKYISEIVEARVEEIFEKVDNELKKINRSALLPAGAVLIGGGAKLHGIVDVAKNKLRLPVVLGSPKQLVSAVDKINDLSFTTALGLVLWGEQVMKQSGKGKKGFVSPFNSVNQVASKLKKWFKNIVP